MTLIAPALALVACGWLLVIAWRDFWTLRIGNKDVAILLALAALTRAAMGFPGGWADLAAGLILFVLGVVFWLLRMMGAGDAKLYLPLGILIGWQGLLPFALLLLPVSVAVLGLMALGRRTLPPASRLGQRLQAIAARRAIPYGVPMVIAAIISLAMIWA